MCLAWRGAGCWWEEREASSHSAMSVHKQSHFCRAGPVSAGGGLGLLGQIYIGAGLYIESGPGLPGYVCIAEVCIGRKRILSAGRSCLYQGRAGPGTGRELGLLGQFCIAEIHRASPVSTGNDWICRGRSAMPHLHGGKEVVGHLELPPVVVVHAPQVPHDLLMHALKLPGLPGHALHRLLPHPPAHPPASAARSCGWYLTLALCHAIFRALVVVYGAPSCIRV